MKTKDKKKKNQNEKRSLTSFFTPSEKFGTHSIIFFKEDIFKLG